MEKVSCAVRITQALAIRGLISTDLCKMTSINKSTMSQYVNGLYEPSQIRVELIARALHVNEAWLMGYDVPMEREKPTTVFDDGQSSLELKILTLFRQIPVEKQPLVLDMIEAALKSQGLLE